MKKAFLALFFTFILALALASCGNRETPTGDSGEDITECTHDYSKMGYHASAHYKVCSLCGEADASTVEAHVIDLGGACPCGCTFDVVTYLDDGHRVYQISFEDFLVKSGSIYARGEDIYTLHTYDESGRRIKDEDVNADGSLFRAMHYEYDTEGKLIKRTVYIEEVLREYYLYEYDAEGKRLKESDYDADGTLDDYTVYIYDASGRVIREEDYDEEDVLDEYHLCEYNAAGKLIKKTTYDESGVLNDTYEYGEDGTILKEIYDYPGEYYEVIERNALGAILKRTYKNFEWDTTDEAVYTRDDSGNLLTVATKRFEGDTLASTELHTYNGKGLLLRLEVDYPSSPEYNSYTVYTYDEQGVRIEQSTYQNGRLYERVRFEYNDKGEETKQIFLDEDGKVLSTVVSEYPPDNTHVRTEYYGDMVSLKQIVIWSQATGEILLEKEFAPNGDVTYFYEGTSDGEGIYHQPEEDDRDCATARHCTDCDFVFAPAREHVYEDGCCKHCGKTE